MKLGVIVRAKQAVEVIEYLNTYEDVRYEYTLPDFYGQMEVSVFLITGNPESLKVIKNYINRFFFTDVVRAMEFREEETIGIDQKH